MVDFFASQIFLTILACWLSAKLIKSSIRLGKGWKFWDIFHPGDFPSEHTALITGVFFSTVFETSWDPVLSSITFFVAALFMYDATHVRLQSEVYAKILNKLPETKIISKEPLPETQGHTYFEVFSGAVVALIVALISFYVF